MIKHDFICGDLPDLRYQRSIINGEKLEFNSSETSVNYCISAFIPVANNLPKGKDLTGFENCEV